MTLKRTGGKTIIYSFYLNNNDHQLIFNYHLKYFQLGLSFQKIKDILNPNILDETGVNL